VLTISANAVALGADTTGNFVGDVASGNGISVSGTPGEGYTETVSLGNLTTDWNQSGAFDIILSNADSQLQLRSADGAAFYGTLDVATLAANKTYVLPSFAGASADVCLTAGNCVGLGGGITGSGADKQVAFFTGASTISSETNLTYDYDTDRLGLSTTSPQATLDLFGESNTLLLRPADVTVTEDTNNSPTLRLRGTYDSDPTGGVAAADFNFDIRHVMTGAGAAPTSNATFDINGGSVEMTLTSAGQLQLPTTGSTGGLLLGGDVNLYRSAANILQTDDVFTINTILDPGLIVGTGGTGHVRIGGLISNSRIYDAAGDLTLESDTGDITFANSPATTNDTLVLRPFAGAGTTFKGIITSANITSSNKTWTFPDASGTVAISATGPITLSALGDIGCTTCLVDTDALFDIAGDSGSDTVNQGETLTIIGGTNITTVGAAGPQVTVNLDDDVTLAGDLTVNGSNVNFGAATDIDIIDDSATALTISEGSNNYLVIDTENAGASVSFGNATTNPTYSFLGSGLTTFGAAIDVTGSVRLGAAGANNTLHTSAAAGAPTGNLFWGSRTLCDDSGSCSGTFENPLTFENGLTRSVNTVRLGGALTADTTITNGLADGNYLTIDLTSTGDFTIEDAGTAFVTFADNSQTTFGAVNPAGGSLNSVTLSGTLGAFDGSGDTFRGLFLDYTNANHTAAGNFYGIDIDAITGDAEGVETAINIGSGWDNILSGTTAGTNLISFTNFSVTTAGLLTYAANGTADNNTYVCKNSSNQLATCSNAGGTGGFVQLQPSSAQTTQNNANSLIWLNEDQASTPNLLELEVGGSDEFVIANNGNITANGDLDVEGHGAFGTAAGIETDRVLNIGEGFSGSTAVAGMVVRAGTLVGLSCSLTNTFVGISTCAVPTDESHTNVIGLDAYASTGASPTAVTNIFGVQSTLYGGAAISSTNGAYYTTRKDTSPWNSAITNLYGLQITDISDSLATNHFGISMVNMTLGNAYGIFLDDAANGPGLTGDFGIYSETSRQNVLVGNTRIGGNTAPTVALDVTGQFLVTASNSSGNSASIVADSLSGGTGLSVSSTGAIISGGELVQFTGNSIATGTLLDLSATALTTGKAINLTATHASAGNAQQSSIDITLTNNQITFSNSTGYNGINLTYTHDPASGLTISNEYIMNIVLRSTSDTDDTTVDVGLRINNADTSASGSTVLTDAIRIDATGNVANAITNAINIASSDVVNDIILQNGERINNDTNGTVLIDDGTTTLISTSTSTTSINLSAQVGGTAQRLCHDGADAATGVQAIGDCGATQADLAEYYGTSGSEESGDLVILSGESTQIDTPSGLSSTADVEKSTSVYDPKIIGVVSTNPSGEVLGEAAKDFLNNPKPIAIIGRVPVKVSAENGDIAPGDPLTSSSTPGVAMKATQSGPIVGKALESFDGAQDDIGRIMVFVSVGWFVAPLDSGSGMEDLGSMSSLHIEGLTSNTINTQLLFVGDRQLSMGPAGELVVDGDVNVLGDVTIEGDLNIDGAVLAKSLRTKSIEIDIPAPDPTTGKSAATIGDATIVAGQTEIVVKTTAVKPDSKIFVTATSTTSGQIPYVVEKLAGESFKVRIDSPIGTAIKFDWWIIQVASSGN
ncbi:MAG: hypothetical protein WD187_02950, partial [Candidatus Woykebacteria bacterium]